MAPATPPFFTYADVDDELAWEPLFFQMWSPLEITATMKVTMGWRDKLFLKILSNELCSS